VIGDVRTELRRASRLIDAPEGSFERLVERRDGARRRRRLATLAVALFVAAVSLGGVTVLLSGLGGRPVRSGSDWEPTRPLSLGPGQYLYLRITSSDLGDGYLRDEETWWGTDGSGEVRNRGTRHDKYPYPSSGRYQPGGFPIWLHGVPSLSTDPGILATQIQEAAYDWEMLLLETPYATPELRASVFEVASSLDGVTVLEDARDPADRPAIALETSERDAGDVSTWRTYFDPGTHQAIAWTFESTRGESAWVLLESGIVDEAGVRPEGAQWLAPPVTEDLG
jgi:hypothetical protein